ncbi:unnamed protein product, partial [Symbiodinium sp. KB8]
LWRWTLSGTTRGQFHYCSWPSKQTPSCLRRCSWWIWSSSLQRQPSCGVGGFFSPEAIRFWLSAATRTSAGCSGSASSRRRILDGWICRTVSALAAPLRGCKPLWPALWAVGWTKACRPLTGMHAPSAPSRRLKVYAMSCYTIRKEAYAALDASVLLRLHRCEVPLAPPWQVKPEPAKKPAEVTMDAVKERWLQYRAQPSRLRTRLFEGGAREKNSDLCFILPAALTRLMRKMRGLGLDTEILKEGAPQGDLVESAEADDRIILYYQAKKLLPARVAHRTYVLQSSAPDEQLREVIEAFDVDVDSDCLCGRCVQCNAWDWNLVGRDAVRGNPQVAEKTLENFDEFWLCGGCGKIYWEGCSQQLVRGLGFWV